MCEMDFPKVSVIVPFYNPGPFFEECVSSIVSQDYDNLEILLINDGSTTGPIPDVALSNEKNIRLLEQPHFGVAAARNFGLLHATGDYVCFLDSDDFFEKKFISELVRSAVEYKSDVVVCGFYYYNQIKRIDEKRKLPLDLFKPSLLVENPNPDIFAFSPNVWNKMFRRVLLKENQIVFQELKTCNDFAFTYQSLVCAKRISLVNHLLVHYRICQKNNISSHRGVYARNIFYALKLVQRILIEKNLLEVYCYTFKLRAFRSIVHEFKTCDFFQKCYFLLSAAKLFSFKDLLSIFTVGFYGIIKDMKRKLQNEVL